MARYLRFDGIIELPLVEAMHISDELRQVLCVKNVWKVGSLLAKVWEN